MSDPLKEYLKVKYPLHHHPAIFNRMNMASDVVDAFKAGMLAAAQIVEAGTNNDQHSRNSLRRRLANIVKVVVEEVAP